VHVQIEAEAELAREMSRGEDGLLPQTAVNVNGNSRANNGTDNLASQKAASGIMGFVCT